MSLSKTIFDLVSPLLWAFRKRRSSQAQNFWAAHWAFWPSMKF